MVKKIRKVYVLQFLGVLNQSHLLGDRSVFLNVNVSKITEKGNEAASRLTSFVQYKYFCTTTDAWHKILG